MTDLIKQEQRREPLRSSDRQVKPLSDGCGEAEVCSHSGMLLWKLTLCMKYIKSFRDFNRRQEPLKNNYFSGVRNNKTALWDDLATTGCEVIKDGGVWACWTSSPQLNPGGPQQQKGAGNSLYLNIMKPCFWFYPYPHFMLALSLYYPLLMML